MEWPLGYMGNLVVPSGHCAGATYLLLRPLWIRTPSPIILYPDMAYIDVSMSVIHLSLKKKSSSWANTWGAPYDEVRLGFRTWPYILSEECSWLPPLPSLTFLADSVKCCFYLRCRVPVVASRKVKRLIESPSRTANIGRLIPSCVFLSRRAFVVFYSLYV